MNYMVSSVWWGIGTTIESQAFVGGIKQTTALMVNMGRKSPNCFLQVTGAQVGPGLGGSGNLKLLLATGVSSIGIFPTLAVEGGWDYEVDAGVSWSTEVKDGIRAAKTAKNAIKHRHEIAESLRILTALIKSVPLEEVLNFSVRNPRYIQRLKPAVESLITAAGLLGDGDDLLSDANSIVPKLRMIPIAGGGFELSATYGFHNRVTCAKPV